MIAFKPSFIKFVWFSGDNIEVELSTNLRTLKKKLNLTAY